MHTQKTCVKEIQHVFLHRRFSADCGIATSFYHHCYDLVSNVGQQKLSGE